MLSGNSCHAVLYMLYIVSLNYFKMAVAVFSAICGRCSPPAPHAHLNVKQDSLEFFQRIFGVCSRFLRDKNVYEPNFANVVVISTLIFCSMCLMMFTLFLFLLLGGYPIRIDVFLVVKHHLFKTSAAI